MENVLRDYSQKIIVFSVICSKTSVYYTYYKNILMFSNICIGSLLTILNSLFTDTNKLKLANISLNAILTVCIAFDKSFQFSEKADFFHKISTSFTTLSHSIDKYNINPNNVDIKIFMNNIIQEYDNLIESINYNIPSYIVKQIITQFGTDIDLPLIVFSASNSKSHLTKIHTTSFRQKYKNIHESIKKIEDINIPENTHNDEKKVEKDNEDSNSKDATCKDITLDFSQSTNEVEQSRRAFTKDASRSKDDSRNKDASSSKDSNSKHNFVPLPTIKSHSNVVYPL